MYYWQLVYFLFISKHDHVFQLTCYFFQQFYWTNHHYIFRTNRESITQKKSMGPKYLFTEHKSGAQFAAFLHYKFFDLLVAAKSWRMNENFPFARAENSVIAPLLVEASWLTTDSGRRGCWGGSGGATVKIYSFSMRIIWLKLGRKLGSSTQHDCMMKARSEAISSGIVGLSCCS